MESVVTEQGRPDHKTQQVKEMSQRRATGLSREFGENGNAALAEVCPNTVTLASIREILCLVKQLGTFVIVPITKILTGCRDRQNEEKVFMINTVNW